MQNVLINRQQLSAPQLAKWHTFTASQTNTHSNTFGFLDGWRIEEVDDAFSDHQKLFNSDLVSYDLSAILQQSIKTICRRQHRRATTTSDDHNNAVELEKNFYLQMRQHANSILALNRKIQMSTRLEHSNIKHICI